MKLDHLKSPGHASAVTLVITRMTDLGPRWTGSSSRAAESTVVVLYGKIMGLTMVNDGS